MFGRDRTEAERLQLIVALSYNENDAPVGHVLRDIEEEAQGTTAYSSIQVVLEDDGYKDEMK